MNEAGNDNACLVCFVYCSAVAVSAPVYRLGPDDELSRSEAFPGLLQLLSHRSFWLPPEVQTGSDVALWNAVAL